jgi:hypothetical protein
MIGVNEFAYQYSYWPTIVCFCFLH